ncbi:MAG: integrin alpha [Planctomycetota bacterium]|nr:integrin alpha [Planctomycetota bacterium]
MTRCLLPTLAARSLTCAAAQAQALQHSFIGQGVQDHFGYAVAGGGDHDLDGHDGLIVSAVFYLTQEGYVRVLSGRTGEVLYAIESEHRTAGFGSDVSGLGDVNSDGVEDLLIGACWDSVDVHYAGAVHVYSGRSGQPL